MTQLISASVPLVPDLAALTSAYESNWSLPSDHLPIGAQVGSVSVLSWNVLNHAFLKKMRQFTPFFDRTELSAESVFTPESDTLTVRERRTAAMVRDFAAKFDVVLVQECGGYFLSELERLLPRHSQLIRAIDHPVKTDICAIINIDRVGIDFSASDFIESAYTSKENRAIMNLLLVGPAGDRLRVVHSHVPGEPTYEAQREFAGYLSRYLPTADSPVLVAGDLNITEPLMREIFSQAGIPPFQSLNSLNTTPDGDGVPKRIDQLFLFGSVPAAFPIRPEDISPETAKTATFLNPP